MTDDSLAGLGLEGPSEEPLPDASARQARWGRLQWHGHQSAASTVASPRDSFSVWIDSTE